MTACRSLNRCSRRKVGARTGARGLSLEEGASRGRLSLLWLPQANRGPQGPLLPPDRARQGHAFTAFALSKHSHPVSSFFKPLMVRFLKMYSGLPAGDKACSPPCHEAALQRERERSKSPASSSPLPGTHVVSKESAVKRSGLQARTEQRWCMRRVQG